MTAFYTEKVVTGTFGNVKQKFNAIVATTARDMMNVIKMSYKSSMCVPSQEVCQIVEALPQGIFKVLLFFHFFNEHVSIIHYCLSGVYFLSSPISF